MSTYKEMLGQACSLTPDEQLRLIDDLISVARH